nr:YceI family protein [uncultured Pedobacter sp.]
MNLNFNKTLLLITFFCLFTALALKAQVYIDKNTEVDIFSSTPVEDIKAQSRSGVSVFKMPIQEIVIQLMVKTLEFDKKLMQQHFNEDYMESDKYPVAKFKGNIEPKIDLTKDGEYNVVAKGILSIHGVDQVRNISGKITVKNGTVAMYATFDIACKAHHIKIPTLVITKVAEIIQVKTLSNLTILK